MRRNHSQLLRMPHQLMFKYGETLRSTTTTQDKSINERLGTSRPQGSNLQLPVRVLSLQAKDVATVDARL